MQKAGLNKTDLFRVLCEKGTSLQSGCDKKLSPYRVIEYQGKKFKLILDGVEA